MMQGFRGVHFFGRMGSRHDTWLEGALKLVARGMLFGSLRLFPGRRFACRDLAWDYPGECLF